MSLYKNLMYKFTLFVCISVLTVSCVTETVESPGMRFDDTAVISVQDPDVLVSKGSTIAWLPEAVRFYQDERMQNAPVKALIEKEIVKNIVAKEQVYVDSANIRIFPG